MAVLTLAQIASHATRLVAAPLLDMSVVSSVVNVAYSHVLHDRGIQHQEREVTATASTSTSDARMALPSDYDYAIGLKVGVPNSWSTATSRTTSWTPLPKLPPPEFNVLCSGPDSATSGTPRVYTEYATWFEFFPSPDSRYSLQLRYASRPSELTLSTATPVLDEQWHWAIVLKTAELLAPSVTTDTDMEARAANRYARYADRLRLDQTKRLMDSRGARVRYVRADH